MEKIRLPAPLAGLMALPAYRAFIVASVLVAFRDAMAEPYLVLFAVEKAQFGPILLGLFLTVRAVGAVIFSMTFGMWLDRRPSVLPLVLSLLLGAAGFVLLGLTTNPILLLLIAGLPLAAGSAAFPQLFALAKGHLDRVAGDSAERGIAVMRASFSAAWAIGPVLGALTVQAHDFTGVFLASAMCGLATWGTLIWNRVRAPALGRQAGTEAANSFGGVEIGVTSAGFVLYFMALVMGSVALPLVVTLDLHGTKADVGILAGTCAFLEVPVMIALAMRPALLGGYGGLVGGFLAMVLYFLCATVVPSVDGMLAAQALRAIGIGLATCIGISYMQDLMPARAGAAAALFTITNQIGSLLAGLAAGEWANLFGYRSMFVACAALCALGLLFLSLGAKPARVSRAAA